MKTTNYPEHEGPAPRKAHSPVDDPTTARWARRTGPRIFPHIRRRILEALASFISKDDEWTQVPQKAIADEADTCRATVIRHLPWLVELGLIEVHTMEDPECAQDEEHAYRLTGKDTNWRLLPKGPIDEDVILTLVQSLRAENEDLRRQLDQGAPPVTPQSYTEEEELHGNNTIVDTSQGSSSSPAEQVFGGVTEISDTLKQTFYRPDPDGCHESEVEHAKYLSWVVDTLHANPQRAKGWKGGFRAALDSYVKNPGKLESDLEKDALAQEFESASSTEKGKPVKAPVTPEFVAEMKEKYQSLDVEFEIERALNHKAVDRAKNVERYIDTWLRRQVQFDSERRAGRPSDLHQRRVEAEKRIPLNPTRRI